MAKHQLLKSLRKNSEVKISNELKPEQDPISAEPTVISSNGTLPTTNGHHTNVSTAKPEPMDTTDLSSAVTSRVSVRSGVAKRAKEKGLIMEQDIDGLEYSSEEETAKPAEELDELLAMSTKKSKADMITTNHEKIYYRPFRKNFYTVVPEI
ncbi:unnamed protein product, partial [Rotaria magnacalcarata]